MRTFGYARVSTAEQNNDRQITALKEVGVKEDFIFQDKSTGADFNRPAYQKLLTMIKSGDLLIIKSLDRLGRDYIEILNQWRYITEELNVDICIIDMPILDTRSNNGLTGKLISGIVLQLLSYIAQTEREFIKKRQAEGIKEAQKKGVKFGRPRLEIPKEFWALKKKYLENNICSREASKILGISHTTFIRWIKKY